MHLRSSQHILHPPQQLHLTGLCPETKLMQTVHQFHDLILGILIHIHSPLVVVMPMKLRRIDKDAPITKQCLLGRMHLLRHQVGPWVFDRIGSNKSNGSCTITLQTHALVVKMHKGVVWLVAHGTDSLSFSRSSKLSVCSKNAKICAEVPLGFRYTEGSPTKLGSRSPLWN